MSPHDWLAGQTLTFARPWLLLLLLLIPLLAWLRGKFGPRAAIVFSATAPFRAIGKSSAGRAGQILRALVWLALAAFIVAIARPQLGKSLTQVEASGIDIMLVLDVSNSMLAKDFTIGGEEATRLDAVREVTREFIEARPNDRIGMIAFGTRPYIVSPMTLDHDWLLQNLDRVRIGLVEGSTAIAMRLASPAVVPLSQVRVIEPRPGGTSQRIMNRLPLPLRTAVIAVRPINDSATSPIDPACEPLSETRVTSVSAGAHRHAISSRFPEPFLTAVRISLSLNASIAIALTSPAKPTACGRIKVGIDDDPFREPVGARGEHRP